MRSVTVALCMAALVSLSGAGAFANQKSGEAALDAALAGEWRSPEAKARDAFRHPKESLTFWGLKPGMTILEIQPGAQSWWTEILAPYARITGGQFYATGPDLSDPKLSEGAKKARAEFEARYASKPETYGKVQVVNWGANSAPLPANKFDFILTARSVHGWIMNDMTDKVFANLYGALKPGGILALEQHRAKPGSTDVSGEQGYVPEKFVIEQAEKAGFKLVAKSEVNANPKDTKDHPFGVWTLPPTRLSAPRGSSESPPGFDRAKYDAIGESDRMTLKFEKPRR